MARAPRPCLVLALLFVLAACNEQAVTTTPDQASTPPQNETTAHGITRATASTPVARGSVDAETAATAVEEETAAAAVVRTPAATAEAGVVQNAQVPVATEGATSAARAAFDPAAFALTLVELTTDLEQATHVTHAGDGSGRLFVVEKPGRIRIVADGTLRPEPFLDITDRVGSEASEQGLFVVAFHPQYRDNGLFFVHYTDMNGDTVISKFRVSSDSNRAEVQSERVLLQIDQPAANHNGGTIAFGPDGYLYIAMGDGGGAGDRFGNGQNRATLLGKLLRIDVDSAEPYGIPLDNPFRNQEGTRPEIWALGLRNPWRVTFDRVTGDLYIGDVGQNAWEELNFQPASSRGGENYGWPTMEATHCFEPSTGCEQEGLQLPVHEYPQELGCSIVAGFRYRGQDVPQFADALLYADYCSGRVWALTQAADGTWQNHDLLQANSGLSSFGEDERGELYLVSLRGGLYRLTAQPK